MAIKILNKKAFTLIELMIVIVILGIIAAFALPGFTKSIEKSYVRDARNNLMAIYDTDNPFQSVMVDTCVVIIQKGVAQEKKILFFKSHGDYSNPSAQEVEKLIYKNAVNKVFFLLLPLKV